MFFTDDSNALVIHKKMPELKYLAQELIAKLCEWFWTNKLTLNLENQMLVYSIHLGKNQ